VSEKRVLKFEGIDYWNRPVFKDDNGNRFGNVDILFDYGAFAKDVLAKINSYKHVIELWTNTE